MSYDFNRHTKKLEILIGAQDLYEIGVDSELTLLSSDGSIDCIGKIIHINQDDEELVVDFYGDNEYTTYTWDEVFQMFVGDWFKIYRREVSITSTPNDIIPLPKIEALVSKNII